MKDIIKSMLQLAEDERNTGLMDCVGELILKLSLTSNAPSNWRTIGEELMRDLPDDSWAKENLYRFGFYTEEDNQEWR